MKLTEAQREALREAANNQFGQLRRPSSTSGRLKAGWRRKCKNLTALGFFQENPFGDYEITEAGRAALPQHDAGGEQR